MICHTWTPQGVRALDIDVEHGISFGNHHRLLRGICCLGQPRLYDVCQRRQLKTFLQRLAASYHAAPQRKPVLWISGGGHLNDQIGHVQTTLRLIDAAHQLDWTIITTGNTLGPFANSLNEERTLRALGLCDWVGVRDRTTFKLLQAKAGPFRRPPQLGRDDAFYDELPSQELPEIAERYELPLRVPFAYVSIHAQPCSDVRLNCESVRQAVDELLTRGIDIVIAPMSGSNSDEVRDAARFQASFPRHRVHVLTHRVRVEDLRALAAHARIIVTTRFHGLVFGLSAGVPSIGAFRGAYYTAKNRDLLNDFGTPELAVPYSHDDNPDFVGAVRRVLASEDQYRELLASEREKLMREQNPVFDWFREYLQVAGEPIGCIPR